MDILEVKRRHCQLLRSYERTLISHGNWDVYWDVHRKRVAIVREYFPHLFFSNSK